MSRCEAGAAVSAVRPSLLSKWWQDGRTRKAQGEERRVFSEQNRHFIPFVACIENMPRSSVNETYRKDKRKRSSPPTVAVGSIWYPRDCNVRMFSLVRFPFSLFYFGSILLQRLRLGFVRGGSVTNQRDENVTIIAIPYHSQHGGEHPTLIFVPIEIALLRARSPTTSADFFVLVT